MSPIKEETIKLIKSLPDDVTLDDIMYELYVKNKILKALEEADKGDFVSHEEAKKRLLS